MTKKEQDALLAPWKDAITAHFQGLGITTAEEMEEWPSGFIAGATFVLVILNDRRALLAVGLLQAGEAYTRKECSDIALDKAGHEVMVDEAFHSGGRYVLTQLLP